MQAISAVEAFHSLDAEGPLFYYSTMAPLEGIERLCTRAGIGLRWLRRATAADRLSGLPRLLPPVVRGSRVMLGSLHQRPFLLAAALARQPPVLLDDGALTETIMARRVAGEASRSWLGRRLDARPLVVFSLYSAPLKPGDVLLPNRLTHVRSLFPGPTRLADEAWIAGQSFVEEGLLSLRAYVALLRRFTRRLAGDPIELVYIQHPRETDDSAASVCAELGVRRRRLEAPLELEILERRRMPRKIFSIGSTVLDTLPLLAEGFPTGAELWTIAEEAASLEGVPAKLLRRLARLRSRQDLHFAGQGVPE